jgi:hypothetical protein
MYRSKVLALMRAKIMKLTYTDSRDGRVIIGFTDERGEHEIALSTIETADLIGALRTSLEEAIGSPAAGSMALPGIERVQIVETAEEVLFRVYMNDRISHDYPVPKGTVLADELRILADRMEARNSAKATHPSPDAQKGKLN